MGEELPRLAGLEGFELWDRTVFKMWGEPEACQVMFDPERRRIALKPADPKEENSYSLGSRVGDGIPCKSLFDFYGVQIFETRRYYDPKVIDGVLVVDL